MEKVNRLNYVDIAKGIGILLVVCSHTDALYLMWPFMGLFVPIFYFCSGYTSSLRVPVAHAVKTRFRKLFIPYIFFNVLLLIVFRHFSVREFIGVFYSRYCLFPLDVSPNVKFMTSGNYPMWFLTSMIVSSFLFYILLSYEKYKIFLIGGYFIVTILFLLCPILMPWSIDTAFIASLFMYVGYIIRKQFYMQKLNIWMVSSIAIIYIGLQIIAGEINLSVRMYGISVLNYFILGCIGSIVVLWGSKYLEGTIVGNFFLLLGHHSMTIFCIQMMFVVWAKNCYIYLFPQAYLGYWAGLFEILFALLGGLLISILFHKCKFISRIAYGA